MAEPLYDYEGMLKRAKEHRGEWVLAFPDVPKSMIKRLWRRQPVALKDIKADSLSFSFEKASESFGQERGRIWVRWNLNLSGGRIPGLAASRVNPSTGLVSNRLRVNRVIATILGDSLRAEVESAIQEIADGKADLASARTADITYLADASVLTIDQANKFAAQNDLTLGAAVTAVLAARLAK